MRHCVVMGEVYLFYSYVEKSQVLMEQRNEGLLSSANQSQNKVLALEQEKVWLFINRHFLKLNSISSNLKLSSTNSFSLEESKICHFVMG